MAYSAVAVGIQNIVQKSARYVGKLQVGINKILWGVNNRVPTVGKVNFRVKNYKGSSTFTQNTPAPAPPGKGENLLTAGLFNALDLLGSLDLCNIIASLTDMIHLKKKPRNPPNGPWNPPASYLYFIQDRAAEVRGYIDKFLAYPNELIGNYVGIGPNAMPPQSVAPGLNQSLAQQAEQGQPATAAQIQNQFEAQVVGEAGKNIPPTKGGTQIKKYNVYFLLQNIKEAFSAFTGPNSFLSAEEKTLLTGVPGLGGSLNVIDDFIGIINKYSDYRNIPNEDLQNLLDKIAVIRSVCVTIEGLDFQSALALAGNFLGVDVRAEIQKLSDFLNPTQIIPTLRDINTSLRSFLKIGEQVQGILSVGQFVIKLIVVLNKVFKFIVTFLIALPWSNLFTTTGITNASSKALQSAKDETDGLTRSLQAINALLSVVIIFLRFLLTNTNELLRRLDLILTNLEICEAVKDSDVLAELQDTRQALINFKEQLEIYLNDYDSKTDPNSAMFGKYDIRVIDEEVTDPGIINKRRRGVALDPNGQIVAQSDLTFATNTAVIIGEVQQKLIALGLVTGGFGQINALTLGVIAESINYLSSNDIAEDDLNITVSAQNSASAASAANISNFLGNLPGGSQFKQTANSIDSSYTANAKQEVKKQADTKIIKP